MANLSATTKEHSEPVVLKMPSAFSQKCGMIGRRSLGLLGEPPSKVLDAFDDGFS